MAIQSIAAFGICNQTTTRQSIGAYGVENETVLAGSPGDTAGAGAALGLAGSLAVAAGAGAALGLRGARGVTAGSGAADGVYLYIPPAVVDCSITALGAINRTSTLQGITSRGMQNETALGGAGLEFDGVVAGAAAVTGLSGSLARAAGAADLLVPVPYFRQAITAYGHHNVTSNRQSIGAYSIFNEAEYTAPGVGAVAGAATVAALRGSVGAVAGVGASAGDAPAGQTTLAAAAGLAACAALGGSLGAGAGTAAPVALEIDFDRFLSGSLGQCAGAGSANCHIINGFEGDGLAAGTASVLALAGPVPGVGTAAGSGAALAVSPDAPVMIGAVAGIGSVAGLSGSLAAATGTAVAQLLSPNGNEGLCVGIAGCAALGLNIGQTQGDASCDGLSGSEGECTGDGSAVAIHDGNIGECVGEARCHGKAIPSQGAGGGHGGRGPRIGRREYVVIDDEVFEVANREEAEALIARAIDLARATADQKAKEAAEAQRRKLVKKPVRGKAKIATPKISVSEDLGAILAEKARAAQAELRAIYEKALDDQVRALIEQDERDVEDALAAAEEADIKMLNSILENL